MIDQKTEEPSWTMNFDLGVRPMAFEQNKDGSTKTAVRAAHGLQRLRGRRLRDAQGAEAHRAAEDRRGKKPVLEGGNTSHGMAVTADNSRLVVDSRFNSAVYVYSLPDLKLLGEVDVGIAPDWVTLTPDGKTAYVANAGSNNVSVVDIVGMKRGYAHHGGTGSEAQHHRDVAVAAETALNARRPARS